MREEVIRLEKVSFGYYVQEDVLKEVSMSIREGDFVCIVGENGSGKSTLIKCILGLNKVQRGILEVKERIGYLPQMTDIQNNFPATIEEVVLSGTIPLNSRRIWYTKSDKEKAEKTLKELDLYDIRKKCFSELSGGQKQRVLIARAICATEKVIFLDEPVNGLDPRIARQIYEKLKQLNREDHLTVVMVSHDIDRALDYSTRVIEIAHGKVVKNMPTSEYKKQGGVA